MTAAADAEPQAPETVAEKQEQKVEVFTLDVDGLTFSVLRSFAFICTPALFSSIISAQKEETPGQILFELLFHCDTSELPTDFVDLI